MIVSAANRIYNNLYSGPILYLERESQLLSLTLLYLEGIECRPLSRGDIEKRVFMLRAAVKDRRRSIARYTAHSTAINDMDIFVDRTAATWYNKPWFMEEGET